MLKDFQVDLELSPKDNRVIQTGATYWSHDVNTAKINIKLLRHSEPVILNKDVTVRVMMLFDDENKSEHIYTAKIEDGKAGIVSIILDKNVRSYVGQVICGVYADYGAEQKTDNGYFTFAMKRSLIDKRMPEMKQYYVSDFEDTLAKMKLANAEFTEVETKLNGRIDVIEKDIASNEVVKKSEFDILKSEYDSLDVGVANLVPVMTGKWTNGYYNENGVLESNQDHSACTEKISIYSDEYTIQIFGAEHLVTRPNLAIAVISYDKNGNFLQRDRIFLEKNNRNINVLKKSENVGYIKVSIPIPLPELENIKIKLEQGNIATDFTTAEGDIVKKNDLTEIKKQIDDIKKAITNLGGTL